MVFMNSNLETYAAFSDYFRYKLLLMEGGIWADLDVVCLRPFLFAAEYVFSSEHSLVTRETTVINLGEPITESINSGVIKAPKGAAFLADAWQTCCSKDPSNLFWTEVGPSLMRRLVPQYGLTPYVMRALTFCPIPYFMCTVLVNPNLRFDLVEDTYGIHLWHEVWRRMKLDPDGKYPSACLYERLKYDYLRVKA